MNVKNDIELENDDVNLKNDEVKITKDDNSNNNKFDDVDIHFYI